MRPETIVVIAGLAVWAALVTAALVAFARALHSRSRRREQYREAVAEAMTEALAAPTRIPRGLSKVEMETCAPASTIVADDAKAPAVRLAGGDGGEPRYSEIDFSNEFRTPDRREENALMARMEQSSTRVPEPKESSGEVTGTCPVCLDDLRVGQRQRTINACGHTFHSRCLRVWLRRDDTCPCCRTRLGAAPPAVDGIQVIQRAQLALLNSRAAAAPGDAPHDQDDAASVIVTISPGDGAVTTIGPLADDDRDEDASTFSRFVSTQREREPSASRADSALSSPVSSSSRDGPRAMRRLGSAPGFRRKRGGPRSPDPPPLLPSHSSSELSADSALRTVIVRSDLGAHRRRDASFDSESFSDSDTEQPAAAL